MNNNISKSLSLALCMLISSASFAGKFKTLDYLYQISGKQTVAGQHNDRKQEAPGPSHYTDKIQGITGKYPGLWGGDFEFDAFRINSRAEMITEAKAQWQKGAIISMMWHACPPTVSEPCSWSSDVQSNLSNSQWDDLITNGGYLNGVWKSRMDEISVYLKDLETSGVEVLFRPLHEMNQGAFWWGGRPGANGTRKLYQLTHDYFTKVKGLTNLIWVWDMQDFGGLVNDLPQYNPGSQYWDVAALDIYEGFATWKYNAMVNIAAGKPIAIGENWNIPSAGRLAAEPLWTFFMGWAKGVFSHNTNAHLSGVYNANNVVSLDEMPGWGGPTNPNPSNNVALGKPVTASSSESIQRAASMIVDGNSTTRWSSDYSGTNKDLHWIYIDLGVSHAIERVKLNWEVAYAKAYEIQVSDDASTWTTIHSVTNGNGGIDDLSNLSGSGRYVRMNATQRATQWGYSLWEMEVYAKSANTPECKPASSDATSTPANAFDGNLTTHWSANGDGQWIQFCLGAEKNIFGVEAAFPNGDQLTAYFDVQVSSDGVTWKDAALNLSSSGKSNGYQSFVFTTVEKAKFVRLLGHGNNANTNNGFSEIKVIDKDPSPGPTPKPYLGSPVKIPGVIEAEHYDFDGFFDTDIANQGGVFRQDAVDIEASTQGSYNVGWTEPGEWLEYTIEVTADGVYNASALVAAINAGGAFHLSIGGTTIASYSVAATGGWQSWVTVTQNVTLTKGVHVVRVSIDSGGFNFNAIEFGPATNNPGPTPVACTANDPWKTANLTNYESYPDPGSEECIKYNGCKWAGYFAGVSGKQPESWVKAHNIAAVHSMHFNQLKLKTLLLRQGNKEIKAVVYDMCGDSDCNGCCTNNLGGDGYLIDIEKYTMQRFGSGSGIVEWKVCK